MLSPYIIVLCLLGVLPVILIALVAMVIVAYVRNRQAHSVLQKHGRSRGADSYNLARGDTYNLDFKGVVDNLPHISTHMLYYDARLHRQDYDEGYPIELPSGEFLGQVGAVFEDTVSIDKAMTLGSYIDFWLFDMHTAQIHSLHLGSAALQRSCRQSSRRSHDANKTISDAESIRFVDISLLTEAAKERRDFIDNRMTILDEDVPLAIYYVQSEKLIAELGIYDVAIDDNNIIVGLRMTAAIYSRPS